LAAIPLALEIPISNHPSGNYPLKSGKPGKADYLLLRLADYFYFLHNELADLNNRQKNSRSIA
jgi:hypothetical protein